MKVSKDWVCRGDSNCSLSESTLSALQLLERPCYHAEVLQRGLLATTCGDVKRPLFFLGRLLEETQTVTTVCGLGKRASLLHLEHTADAPPPPVEPLSLPHTAEFSSTGKWGATPSQDSGPCSAEFSGTERSKCHTELGPLARSCLVYCCRGSRDQQKAAIFGLCLQHTFCLGTTGKFWVMW